MIEIEQNNLQTYFEDETFKELLDILKLNATNESDFLPRTGIGCICISDTKIIAHPTQNVYIEYTYEKLEAKNFQLDAKRIVIFEGAIPAELKSRIDLISQELSSFRQMN